ncbi:MAG: membrane protein insertase YidC [Flavobacteriales bacterium]|nr:membrane protein insertase YidC [Flavobacteriales bacterium]
MDTGSLVGFVLVMALFLGYMWYTAPSAEQMEQAKKEQADALSAEKAAKELQEKNDADQDAIMAVLDSAVVADSNVIPASLIKKYGDFAYSATLPSAKENKQVIVENDTLRLVFASKGGMPVEVELKQFQTYSKTPLYIVKDANADFNMAFYTADGRKYDTRDLYFDPIISKEGKNTVVSMRAMVSENQYLEYRYVIRPNEYMLDFSVQSKGLSDILKNGQEPILDWKLDAIHTEKGLKNENLYSYLMFSQGEKQKVDDLSAGGSDDETVADLSWFAFKQQFFSTILLTKGQNKATLKSETYDADSSLYTKRFIADVALPEQKGDFNIPMSLYFGPNNFHTLDSYGNNLDEILPLGWAIFRWINRWAVIPMFDLLFYTWGISMGIVILIMTLVIKLVLMFFTYSSYKSQAKMRLLRPEMTALNEKYKDADPAKKQQATMELYSKAGVNPLAGCLPMLLQMPILIAMYRFFPSAIELRGQSFLWAEDLSAYDSILNLPFNIPLYGANISLFALLMAVTLFFSTKMSGSGMDQPTQPGMPNMKFMMYLMPVMMIFWFNTAASGLSYYYALSSLITILQVWVIKKYFVNESKLHAKMMENAQAAQKKGPSKWQRKMDEMLKQAQENQNRQQRRSKK